MEEKDLQNLNEKDFIEQYKKTEKDKYEKPSVTTDMVIFTVGDKENENKRRKAKKELRLLLIKRGGHPYKGDWALAGGFMGIDEDLNTAVQRELYEETGVTGVYAEQLYTWSAVDRDPRMRIISASYLALVDHEKISPLKAGDDAADIGWFTVKDEVVSKNITNESGVMVHREVIKVTLTSGKEEVYAVLEKESMIGTGMDTKITVIEQEGLAFDHAKIILYSLERLRGKINYTNVAFNLVGEEFTLPDLQEVYEIILGRKLQKVGFRRHVEDMVIDTGKELKEGAYRPSKLYSYNKEWEYGELK